MIKEIIICDHCGIFLKQRYLELELKTRTIHLCEHFCVGEYLRTNFLKEKTDEQLDQNKQPTIFDYVSGNELCDS